MSIVSGLYGSLEAQRLRQWEVANCVEPEKRLDSFTTSAYEIGFDFVQVFNHIQHSTGVMMLRYFLSLHSKACAASPLLHASLFTRFSDETDNSKSESRRSTVNPKEL